MSVDAVPRLIEHYPGCPCPTCNDIRQAAHTIRQAGMSVTERVQETLDTKTEPNGRRPERAMFNCGDIAQLLDIIRSLS